MPPAGRVSTPMWSRTALYSSGVMSLMSDVVITVIVRSPFARLFRGRARGERSWGCALPRELGGDRRRARCDEPAQRGGRQVAFHQARHAIRLVLGQLGAAGRGPADGLA